jgi:hypothetical protein
MSRRVLGDTSHVRRRAPTTARDKAKAARRCYKAAQSHDPEHAYDFFVAAIREMLEQVLDERNLSGRVEPV